MARQRGKRAFPNLLFSSHYVIYFIDGQGKIVLHVNL